MGDDSMVEDEDDEDDDSMVEDEDDEDDELIVEDKDDDKSIMVEYTLQEEDDKNATMIEEIDLNTELVAQLEQEMNFQNETDKVGMEQLVDAGEQIQMNQPVIDRELFESEMNKEVPDTQMKE